MKKIYLLFIIFASPLIYSQVPIQYYDFELNSDRTGTGELSPEIIINLSSGSSLTSSSNAISYIAQGSGLAISRNNWPTALGDPGVSNAEYIQFKANSSGFSGISISAEAYASVLNLNNISLLYATDGINFNNAGSKSLSTTTAEVHWDISNINNLNNNNDLTFRIYAWSSLVILTGSESLIIDNLKINVNEITSSNTLGNYQLIADAVGSFPVFQNLTINSSGGNINLSSSIYLNGTLTLTSGNIITNSFTVYINNPGTINGGSSSGFIDGNLSREFSTGGSDTKDFPIGNSSDFRPIQLTTAGLDAGGSISAHLVNSAPTFTSLPAGVNTISNVRYWSINLDNGITFSNIGLLGVKLFWGNGDGISSSDLSSLRVVNGTNGGDWTEASNTGTSGSTSSGWVLGSFNSPASSDFTIGDTNANPLPIELSSFTYEILRNQVLLHWQTKTEINSYSFEIERVDDIKNEWIKIGEVKANGNSNSDKNYSFNDESFPGGKSYYRLKMIDNDGSCKYSKEIEVNSEIPYDFILEQNYPNPFNPETKIEFSVPKDTKVKIKIYDALGRKIKILLNKNVKAGIHKISWNGKDNFGSDTASGIYIYSLESENIILSKKMILLR